jgi:hypothetical protein
VGREAEGHAANCGREAVIRQKKIQDYTIDGKKDAENVIVRPVRNI